MKRGLSIISFFVLCTLSSVNAVSSDFESVQLLTDSISNLTKKEKKEQGKQELKENGQRLFIKANYVYAKLNTSLTFDLENSIFSARISLEDNFKLPSTRLFFTGSLIYRFNQRSGIYVAYYGITRSATFTTEKEYIFLDHTIPTGINGKAYFDTRVITLGYLLTIIKREHAYLGMYFNVYFMNLSTGFKSENIDINENLGVTLPLPNIGLAAIFPVTNWFKIHANVGYFGISFEDFGGNINNFELSFEFKPIHWLGLNLSYQSFDISIYDIEDGIDFIVDYNFKGPAVGISVNF